MHRYFRGMDLNMVSKQNLDMESLRAVIVEPLMDMMRTLSGEMQRNLSEEVARIHYKMEAVERKVDYIINRTDGNNINTKGEHNLVADSLAFTHDSQRGSLEHDEDSSTDTTESLTKHLETGQVSEVTDEIQLPEIKLKVGDSPNDSMEQRESYVEKFTTEKRILPGTARMGEINLPGSNIITQLERKYDSDQDSKDSIPGDQEKEDQETEDRVEEMPMEEEILAGFPKDDSETFPDDVNPVLREITTDGDTDLERRQELLKFGNAEIHMRTKSPPTTTSVTENEPYTGFRKTKTEVTDDNRTNYQAEDFSINDEDVETERTDESDANRSMPSDYSFQEHENQITPTMTNDSKAREAIHLNMNNFNQDEATRVNQDPEDPEDGVTQNRVKRVHQDVDIDNESTCNDGLDKGVNHEHEKLAKDVTQDPSNMSNNKLAPSGFKNEHGDEDNRFLAAAHGEVSGSSIRRSSSSLSNLQLVKNGLSPTKVEEQVLPTRDTGTREKHGRAVGRSPVSVRNGNLVPENVLYALIEKERLSVGKCEDVKSDGIDTVICLDTSLSMSGKPIKTALDAARRLIDGFENNAIYNDLEENVAIVTFGKENKILRHLTNDYGLLREALDTVTTGGPSPLWLGIALSLTEIKERGGACNMNPMTVLPRIILVTDGYASRKNLLAGEDDNNSDDAEVVREILSLMNTCRSFTSYMECITVGSDNEQAYKDNYSLKALTGGRMYTVEDVDHLVQFFRIQEEANNLVKGIVDGTIAPDNIEESVKKSQLGLRAKEDIHLIVTEAAKTAVQQTEEEKITEDTDEGNTNNDPAYSKASEEDKTDQPEEVPDAPKTETQPKEPTAEQTPNEIPKSTTPTSSSLSSLEDIDDVDSPMFGAAVEPNPDWVGFHSRQNLNGTVIGNRKKGHVKILWSDGTTERCKYGVAGQYDIKISDDQSIDYSELRIGSLVKRGKDWRWEDQDGGKGNVGVVLKIDGSVLHVTWPHGGQGNYRYGYNKKYDLKLCETRQLKGSHPAWFVLEEEGKLNRLPAEASESIEQMYQTNHPGTFLVTLGERSLRVSIQNLQARDTNTRVQYPIVRKELTQEQWSAMSKE